MYIRYVEDPFKKDPYNNGPNSCTWAETSKHMRKIDVTRQALQEAIGDAHAAGLFVDVLVHTGHHEDAPLIPTLGFEITITRRTG